MSNKEEELSSKQQMPQYTYYYGLSKEQVIKLASMSYKHALIYKINSTKSLLGHCLDKDFMERDITRINDIIKARKFNEKLLKELEY